ncbi:hypothetical protein D3C81_176850 [compost metagenome]
MSDCPESFGPLTPAEDTELEAMIFKDDSLYDLEQNQKWYQRVVNGLLDSDPSKRRFETELKQITRCLDLKRRKGEWGVASIVELTQTFPKE